MNNLQTQIQQLLDQWVGDGTERGAQAALYVQGQLAIDAVAGVANVHTGEKVTSQTLFPVYSTTKGMVATLAHRLVERGLFDYETPIATLWPEFAANGKDGITVRHALNHTSGLYLMPLDATREDISDWDSMCRKIAAMPPAAAPGERTEYHAITFGYILGEVASRATGLPFSQLWHDEICAPLGVEDEMFCGLPADSSASIAWLEEPNAQRPEPPSPPAPEAVPYWVWPLSEWMNTPQGRQSVVPASSGIMSARAIARHYASLVNGGVDGIHLLPLSRVQTALSPQPPTQQPNEDDEFFLGYAQFEGGFGHWGFGGSMGMGHPEQGWALGFTHNLFTEQNPAQTIIDEVKAHFSSDSAG